MAKITLNTILSSFASTSLFNTNFSAIQTELNDKVLYRNNPVGEANEMLNDLDMNSNDILNAGDIATATITVGGVDLTAQVAAAATSAANAATSESNAAASAALADSHKSNAAASASAASTSETNAATSEANAAASVVAAQAVVDNLEGDVVFTDTEFTSSAGQDTFSVNYTVGQLMVLLNGVDLSVNDFTAVNGTTVVLNTPLANNSDVLKIRTYKAFAAADTPSRDNLIVNGDFSIWQRGTSGTEAVIGYNSVDRWYFLPSGTGAYTVSRQNHTVGQTDVPGNPKYFMRFDVTTGDNGVSAEHRIEDVTLTSNREVTLSFYAKGTNPGGGVLSLTAEQNFGTGGSPSAPVNVLNQTVTLAAGWQKYTFTFTPTSVSGKTLGTNNNDYLKIDIRQPNGDFSGDPWTLDMSQIKLEIGPTATDFEYVSPADQLARCKRYFERIGRDGQTFIGSGYAENTSSVQVLVDYSEKRDIPSVTVNNPTSCDVGKAGASATVSSLGSVVLPNLKHVRLDFNTSAVTAGEAVMVSTGAGGNASVDIDAEL